MQLEYTNLTSAVALVDRRPQSWKNALFCTISPNPNTKHTVIQNLNGKKTTIKKSYGMLKQSVQYEYCCRIVRSAYMFSHDTKIFGTWELNKSGNVHFHLIMTDPFICNKSSLAIFQRDVMNNYLVILNMCKSKNPKDMMNNIVFVNDTIEKRMIYMTKEMDMNLPIMPYFYYGNVFLTDPQRDVMPAAGPPRVEPPEESEGPTHVVNVRELTFNKI